MTQNQSSNQIDLNSCQIKLYRMSNTESECPWGLKAVKLLQERGLNFEDIKLRSREEVDKLKGLFITEYAKSIANSANKASK